MPTIIEAYRRKKTLVHAFRDITLVFHPNLAGDVVCAVELDSAIERLLAEPTAFRVYKDQPEPEFVPSSLLTGEVSAIALMTAQFQALATTPVLALQTAGVASLATEQVQALATAELATLPPTTLADTASPAPAVADKEPDQAPPVDDSPYLLRSGEASYDLRPLDDAALRAFAGANSIKVAKALTGDAIRDKIVEALKA